MKKIRAFIAIKLPLPLIEKVAELQSELRLRARHAGMKVAWVPPPNMHVTLKFLAEIPEENVFAIRDLLQERLAARVVLPLVVRGTGAFPTRAYPRVFWVGVESENNALPQLAADVDAWLADLGFSKETRPFHPHLTLGRVKQGSGDLLEGLEAMEFGNCTLDQVVLYQSVLQRQGAEHTALARIPLVVAPTSNSLGGGRSTEAKESPPAMKSGTDSETETNAPPGKEDKKDKEDKE